MILNYVHDPMCSWCWAYRPVRILLRQQLPSSVTWRNLLGGLASDSDEPMPERTKIMVRSHWKRIQRELGTEFNFEFWTRCEPRRSTYPACRAVLAAANQGREEEMIEAIQRAYYLRAMNPSDEDVLVQIATELECNATRFRADLNSQETEHNLQMQLSQVSRWPVSGFPSLVLQQGNSVHSLPLDYRSPRPTLEAISRLTN